MKISASFPILVALVLLVGQTPVYSAEKPESVNVSSGSQTFSAQNFKALKNFTVGEGATAVIDFGSKSKINMKGDLHNSGTILAVSSNSNVKEATIAANNVLNQTNGLITTVLPGGSIAGLPDLNTDLSLTVTALNKLVNYGTISSAANLSISGGKQFINQGTLSAVQNLNVFSGSGNFVNSGVLASLVGNVNVNTLASRNLVFNNANGVIEALKGSINFRDALFDDNSDLSILGGNLLAKEVNLNSGHGDAALNVDIFDGVLNATACNLVAVASADTLVIGDLNIVDDPAIVNMSGAVQILSDPGVGPLLVAASTDIIGPVGDPNFRISNNSGDIFLIAGANITQNGGFFFINGPSATGGNIDFSNQSPTFFIRSRATNQNAGNITMVAYNVNADTGKILMPLGSEVTSVSQQQKAGNISFFAGNGAGNPAFVNIKPLTLGKVLNSGDILIHNSNPVTSDGQPLQFNQTTGAKVSTNTLVPGTFAGGTATVGAIQTNGSFSSTTSTLTVTSRIEALDAGSISINANGATLGGDLISKTGNITVVSNGVLTMQGAFTNGAGAISISTTSGDANINSSLHTGGGNIAVSASQNLAFQSGMNINTYGTGATGVNAGSVQLVVSSGTLTGTGFDILTQRTGTTGASGNIFVSSTGSVTLGQVVSGAPVGGKSGGNVAITSRQDITVSSINSQGGTSHAGNVTVVAGAQTTTSSSEVNFSGPSGSGGGVFIAGGVDASARAGTSNGGNVNLIAYDGGTPTGTSGQVQVGAVKTGGFGTGLNGSVTLLAGRSADDGPANLSVGAITATGGSGNSAPVLLATTQPLIVGGPAVINRGSATLTTGSFDMDLANLRNTKMTMTGFTTTNGGDVTAVAGNNISFSVIQTDHVNGSGNGGDITLFSNAGDITMDFLSTSTSEKGVFKAGNVLIGAGGNITNNQGIQTGKSGSGNDSAIGGNVNVVSSKTITFSEISTSSFNGQSGHILLAAGVPGVTYDGTNLTFNTPNGTTSGNIQHVALGGRLDASSPLKGTAGSIYGIAHNNGTNGGIDVSDVSGKDITLIANGAMSITGNISSTGAILVAGANPIVNGGSMTINEFAGEITSGSFSADTSAGPDVVIAGTVTGPSITILSGAGSITAQQAVTASGGTNLSANNILLQAAGNIVLNANTVALGNITMATTGGNIILNHDVTVGGLVEMSANGPIQNTYAAAAPFQIGNVAQVGQPTQAVLSPLGNALYILGGNQVVLLDPKSGGQIGAFNLPLATVADQGVFSADGKKIYIGATNTTAGNRVVFIVEGNKIVSTINLPASVYSMAVNPKREFAYVTTQGVGGSTLFIINGKTNAVVQQINRPSQEQVAVDASGQFLLLANATSVTRFKLQTGTVVGTAAIGGATNIVGATMDPSGSTLYLIDGTSNTLFKVNPVSLALVQSYSLGGNKPISLVVNNTGTAMYVTTATAVLKIDAVTGVIDQTFAIGNTGPGNIQRADVGVVDNRYKVFVPNQFNIQSVQLTTISHSNIKALGVDLSSNNEVSVILNSQGLPSSIAGQNANIAEMGAGGIDTSSVTGTFLYGTVGNLLTAGDVTAGTLVIQSTGYQSDLEIGGNITTTGALTLYTFGSLLINTFTLNAGTNASFNAPNVELVGSTITAPAGAITFNSPFDSTLTVEGTGTLSASTNVTFNSSGPNINFPNLLFDGQFTFTNGTVVLNAVNGIVTLTAESLLSNPTGTIEVNSCSVINPGGLVANQVVLNTSPDCALAGGCGTLTNPLGDIILTSNLILNVNGQAFAIIASGNIIAQTGFTVDLSSKTQNGGDLTFLAGYTFTPAEVHLTRDQSTTFTVGAASATGGSVMLDKVTINTSTISPVAGPDSTTGDAGSVTIVAHSGNLNKGTITVSSINTSSLNGTGGDVILIGQGGVQVGDINAKGGALGGGNVQVSGAEPTITGTIQIVNGIVSGGGFSANNPVAGVGANINILGNIDASSASKAGGNVSLKTDGTITVAGDILTNVLKGGVGPGAGSIALTTTNGRINVGGSLNAGGSFDKLTTSNLDAANGGNVTISPAALASIGGNIITSGGSTEGTGNGGNAGKLTLTTLSVGPGDFKVGNITVQGYIDMRGGSSTNGQNGGIGNSLSVTAGSFVVQGANNSASINTGGGKGKGGTARGGQISINTWATQPLPAAFDLTSSAKTIIALPGGMFSVGDGLYNGTKGTITNGSRTADSNNAARITNAGSFNQPGMTITVVGGPIDIRMNGIATGITPDDGAGKRTLITPGMALAAYQLTRDPGNPLTKQTIGLNGLGQVTNEAPPGGNSRISINSYDFPTLTVFNLSTVEAGNLITLNLPGSGPVVDLSNLSSATINGTIAFQTGGSKATLLFGPAVTISSTGSIQSNTTGTLTLGGKLAKLNNAGSIKGNNITINTTATSLSVIGTGTGQFAAYSGTGNLTINSSGISLTGLLVDTVLNQAPNSAKLGTVDIQGTFQGTAAIGNMNALSLKVVTPSNIKLADGALVKAATVFLQTAGSHTVTIGNGSSLLAGLETGQSSGKITIDTSTTLTVGNNAVVTAKNTILLQNPNTNIGTSSSISTLDGSITISGSTLVIDKGSKIEAGVLQVGTPTTGVLSSNNIVSSGSISINISTTLTMNSDPGADTLLIRSIGGDTTISGGTVTIGNAATFRADGGNLVINGSSKITAGDSNTFVARSVGTAGGGIAVGAGPLATLQTALKNTFSQPSGTAPAPATFGSNVIIDNSGGTSGAITAANNGTLNLSGGGNLASLDVNGGAMTFNVSSVGNEVTMNGANFTTYGSKPVSHQSTDLADEFVIDTGDCEFIEDEILAVTAH